MLLEVKLLELFIDCCWFMLSEVSRGYYISIREGSDCCGLFRFYFLLLLLAACSVMNIGSSPSDSDLSSTSYMSKNVLLISQKKIDLLPWEVQCQTRHFFSLGNRLLLPSSAFRILLVAWKLLLVLSSRSWCFRLLLMLLFGRILPFIDLCIDYLLRMGFL